MIRRPEQSSVKELLTVYKNTIESADTTKGYRKFFRAVETYVRMTDPVTWFSSLERSRTRAIARLNWQDNPIDYTIGLAVRLELAPLFSDQEIGPRT